MTIQPIKSTQSLNLNTNQPHRSVIPGKGKLVAKGFKELYLKERADREQVHTSSRPQTNG